MGFRPKYDPEHVTLEVLYNPEIGTPPGGVYHIFTRKQKKFLVLLVSLAAVFSPLSSNIYFPALVSIANVSVSYIEKAR